MRGQLKSVKFWFLRNEVDGVKRGRSMWSVELIGGVNDPGFAEGDRSLDFIP